MVKCCVPLCYNASYRKTPEVTFYRFPKDEYMKHLWIKNINRKDWQPNSWSVIICSKHFSENAIERNEFRTILSPGAIPTIFKEKLAEVSPEGLIGELTVLEEKCPFSIKDEFISVDNYKHIEMINNEYCLKESSPTIFKFKNLLGTKRKYCDFFVWTNKDEKRIYVNRNDKLISEVL